MFFYFFFVNFVTFFRLSRSVDSKDFLRSPFFRSGKNYGLYWIELNVTASIDKQVMDFFFSAILIKCNVMTNV